MRLRYVMFYESILFFTFFHNKTCTIIFLRSVLGYTFRIARCLREYARFHLSQEPLSAGANNRQTSKLLIIKIDGLLLCILMKIMGAVIHIMLVTKRSELRNFSKKLHKMLNIFKSFIDI